MYPQDPFLPMTVEGLIAKGEQVYVRNRVGDFIGKVGPYFLQLKSSTGEKLEVMVPATKHPCCLSAKAPSEFLARSADLQMAINKGVLQLLDPQAARREMSDPHAQRAVQIAEQKYQAQVRAQPTSTKNFKIRHRDQDSRHVQMHNAGTNPEIPEDGIISGPQLPMAGHVQQHGHLEPVGQQAAATTATVKSANGPAANPKIMQLVMDLKKNPGMREEIRFSLEELEDVMTEEDLQYCIRECQDFKQVAAWCRSQLAERRNEDYEAVPEPPPEADVQETESADEQTKPNKRRRRRK